MEKRLPHTLQFIIRVLRDFFTRNHGLMLTAAVAHNMMLSLIPLCAVLMVVVSHFFDQELLLKTLTAEISLIAPGFTPTLTEVLLAFLRTREIIGWLGLLTLLFFSSMAFRVMEDAISVISHRPLPSLKRKFWVSALMPYLFVLIVAAGLIVITTVNAVVDAQSHRNLLIFGVEISLGDHAKKIIYLTGLLGLFFLFTLFYKIMPVARISLRLALAGGFTATVLWEIVRYALVYYYTKISIVNVVYGSMATIIVVLLTLEAIAFILLLGSQVIANLQSSANANVRWYEEPNSD
jgi:membrane protein